jgi:hypothetical protein
MHVAPVICPFVLLHFALAPVTNLHPFLIALFHFWFNTLLLAAHWTLLGDHRYHGKEQNWEIGCSL